MAKESEEQVRQRTQVEREKRRQDELREQELAKKQQQQQQQEQDAISSNRRTNKEITTGREKSISSAINAFNNVKDEVKSPTRAQPIKLPTNSTVINGEVAAAKANPPDVVPNEAKLKFQEV